MVDVLVVCTSCKLPLSQVLRLDPYCVFAHALLADVYAAQAVVLAAAGAVGADAARTNALVLLRGLQELDPLRRGYWKQRAVGVAGDVHGEKSGTDDVGR